MYIFMKFLHSRKGFTLIELLIVIAIIGLLASMVLVGFGTFRSRGRDARRIADMREVQNALELFYTKSNRYPDATEAADWAGLTATLLAAGIGINAVPNDPLPPAVYLYSPSTDFQNYVIGATMEDPAHPVLLSDVDDPVNFPLANVGVSCGDAVAPVYCVAF